MARSHQVGHRMKLTSNLAVKDINNASNKFNSVNNTLNNNRKLITNDWDNTVNSYLEKYVPDTNKKK